MTVTVVLMLVFLNLASFLIYKSQQYTLQHKDENLFLLCGWVLALMAYDQALNKLLVGSGLFAADLRVLTAAASFLTFVVYAQFVKYLMDRYKTANTLQEGLNN